MDLDELFNEFLNTDDNPTLQLPDPSLLQFYQNLSNRIYWITGDIDEGTLDVIEKILYWNRQDKDIPVEQRKPIILYIRSNGGDLDVEETVVSIIELSKTPIYGVAMGTVASAASLIYLSCHKKYAINHATFILHHGSGCFSGTTEQVMAAVEDYKNSITKMEEFYITHTAIPQEVLSEKIKSDWYIRASDKEALEYKLVDEIITDLDVII